MPVTEPCIPITGIQAFIIYSMNSEEYHKTEDKSTFWTDTGMNNIKLYEIHKHVYDKASNFLHEAYDCLQMAKKFKESTSSELKERLSDYYLVD